MPFKKNLQVIWQTKKLQVIIWGCKCYEKQEREQLLDDLDEEKVLDLGDTRQEGFRNIFNLRKYKQSKANAESIKQNAKRFLSNQNLDFFKI